MKKIVPIIIVFIATIFFGLNNNLAMEQFREKNLVGNFAPAFNIIDINGNMVNSSDFLGKKPLILFFWATWCPHCRKAIRDLNDIYPGLKAKGAELINIDLGEKKNRVSDYLQTYNYNLITLLDEESTTVDSYGVVGVPTFFIVDSSGIVRFQGYSLPENYLSILFKN